MQTNHNNIWRRIGKAFNRRQLNPYFDKLNEINRFCVDGWKNEQLQEQSLALLREARNGVDLDRLLIPAFALAREAVWRVIGIHLYDVQVVAGIALHQGNLIEMQTGEGKTLAAVLPAYLHALQGNGVHILTFNDYLARRDAQWMGPIFRFLGLSVGFVQDGMDLAAKKEAYAADITYLTAKQAGFDFLKDSLCYEKNTLVQRLFHFVLVDEADSILIDEARVPLVIAGEVSSEENHSGQMADVVRGLTYGDDYDTDQSKRNVFLTEAGADKAEAILGCGNLYEVENTALLTALHCALHAEALLKRNVDYIIREGKVELVDEFTGRIADHRHWPDGLQAAVEAKEGLQIQSGGKILGTITLQHLLSLYPKMCGMTATAQTSADEFREVYGLDVVVIPPNRPCKRIDHPHLVFTHKEAKYRALVAEVKEVHQTGSPILIGTASVEESNELAKELERAGIPCQVLNAQNDEREAKIISKAGTLGAVTVSTNMAGRGVDIVLGGGTNQEYAKVVELGGLYIIGTNLHDSIRVDHQLRGRAGRQGDPGSSRFFISLDDELLLRFGVANAIGPEYLALKQEEPLQKSVIAKTVAHIQRVVEGQNFEIRKTLNRYSNILEQQRRMMYRKRWDVLMDVVQPTLCSSREPERYYYLCKKFGITKIQYVEKHITLFQIDQCWADYLAYVAYIKEGIHLESISNKNPLDEFHRLLIQEFELLPDKIEQEILNSFLALDLTKGFIDLEQGSLKKPSATWTYIVNDSFFQNRTSLV